MNVPPPVRRALELGARLAALAAFLPPLLTRLVLGLAFYQTGSGKIANLDNVVGFFTELGVPFPELNAAFVSRVEYYGGLLLIVGLATRLAAALLGSTMVVALATADRASFVSALQLSGDTGLTDVVPVMWGILLLWLLVQGPGLVSLDALLARWLGRQAEAGEPAAVGGGAASAV